MLLINKLLVLNKDKQVTIYYKYEKAIYWGVTQTTVRAALKIARKDYKELDRQQQALYDLLDFEVDKDKSEKDKIILIGR